MKEELLHFIWKYKLFYKTKLLTSDATELQILSVGSPNVHSGPDFLNAKIKLGAQLWVGNIEIHVKSSDWYVHHHEIDPNYDAVILHVVWEEDVPVIGADNRLLPTLELKNLVPAQLLKNYSDLFLQAQKWIYCEKDIASIPSFIVNNWLERLYVERLEHKSLEIQQLLEKSMYDWEAVLFQLLSKNFGLKVNSGPFFDMAVALDYGVVKKERQKIFRLESLLFGQLGMLNNECSDSYIMALKKEYSYQSKKYNLPIVHGCLVQYFRLRPSNFPTIRISQLAHLFCKHSSIFSKIMEVKNLKGFYDFFEVSASSFWDTHYTFDKESKKHVKKLTKSFIDLLIINTVLPLKFVYLKHKNRLHISDFLQLIKELKPEKNTIVERFSKLNISSSSAFETQALLELKNNYCNHKKCLQCAIGNSLLRK